MMNSHFGKTVLTAICIGLWAAGAWALVPPPAGAKPVTISGNADDSWDTIQEAVDAASENDTINVATGTYPGNVTINVANLTIRGNYAGVHPAVGTHPTESVGTREEANETVITGTVAPLAAGIVLDGLKFESEADRNITAHAGATDVSGFTIMNCIFDWTVGDWPSYTTGHLELYGNYTDFTFQYNRLVVDSDSAAMYLKSDGDNGDYEGLTCQYNYISSYYESIFFAAAPLVDAVIKGNEISGDLGYGGTDYGACTFNIGKAGNIQFTDNEIHDVWHTVAQLGIDGGKIADNTWRDMLPYDDDNVYLGSACIQLWGGQWSTTVSTNVEITGNTFMYNSDVDRPMAGIRLLPQKDGSADPTIDASTIHIHKNYFINLGCNDGSLAVRNDADQTKVLDATHNWWDTIRPDQIDDVIQGEASVTPYLLSPRGDLFVDDTWAGTAPLTALPVVTQTIPDSAGTTPAHTEARTPIMGVTGFATLQDALDGALPGETIYVAAGTYGEGSTVWTLNQSLRVVGPQVGVDPTAGGRTVPAEEAVLNGGVVVDADVYGTAIGGLSINSGATGALALGGNAESTTLYHTVLEGTSAGLATSNSGATGLTVYQNRFTGYGDAVTLNAGASDVLIDDNSFVTCGHAISTQGTTGLQVTDNAIQAGRGVQLLDAAGTPNTEVTLIGNGFVGYPAGTFEWYVDLQDGGINGTGRLNGLDNSFEGVPAASMTAPQFDALQDKVQDFNDNTSYGRLVFEIEVTAYDTSADPDQTISLTALVEPRAVGRSVSFTVDGAPVGSATTDASGVATLSYKAALAEGAYDIVANYGGGSDGATLTVSGNHGEAATIVVTGPDGAGNDPVTVVTGGTAAYTAAATDAYGTSWNATTEVDWQTSAGAGGSWAANVYTTEMFGTWDVTATLDGVASTPVQVIVQPIVTADDTSADPDETISLTASVTPAVEGLSVSFSVDGTPVGSAATDASGVATLSFKAAMGEGAYDIVASYGGVSDTATLTVSGNHGEVVTIVVTGPEGAGNDPVTVVTGGTAAYTAAATDAYGTGWDASAEVDWQASAGAGGSWAANVYAPLIPGTWEVKATLDGVYSSPVPVIVEAALTVDAKAGHPDDSIFLTASVGVAAQGLSVSFSVDGTPVGSALTDASGVATLEYVAARAPGIYPIVATQGSATSDPADLTLTGHGKAVTIDVTGPTGPVSAGTVVTYTAQAWDAYGTDWIASDDAIWWASPSALGAWGPTDLDPTLGPNEYTTQVSGNWKMSAGLNGHEDFVWLTVEGGIAATLSIDPATKTARVGEQITFMVTASDAFGNKWDASTSSTTNFNDEGGTGTFAANVYTVGAVGGTIVSITASDTVTGAACTATITVEAGAVVKKGNPLRYDPSTERFILGSTPVPSTGWYGLGNGTGADIYIVVTAETQIKAEITKLNLNDGSGVKDITVTNQLAATPAYRRGNLSRLDQVSQVDASGYLGYYLRLKNETYLYLNGTAAPGKLVGFLLLNHTVALDGTIGQRYELAP